MPISSSSAILSTLPFFAKSSLPDQGPLSSTSLGLPSPIDEMSDSGYSSQLDASLVWVTLFSSVFIQPALRSSHASFALRVSTFVSDFTCHGSTRMLQASEKGQSILPKFEALVTSSRFDSSDTDDLLRMYRATAIGIQQTVGFVFSQPFSFRLDSSLLKT